MELRMLPITFEMLVKTPSSSAWLSTAFHDWFQIIENLHTMDKQMFYWLLSRNMKPTLDKIPLPSISQKQTLYSQIVQTTSKICHLKTLISGHNLKLEKSKQSFVKLWLKNDSNISLSMELVHLFQKKKVQKHSRLKQCISLPKKALIGQKIQRGHTCSSLGLSGNKFLSPMSIKFPQTNSKSWSSTLMVEILCHALLQTTLALKLWLKCKTYKVKYQSMALISSKKWIE